MINKSINKEDATTLIKNLAIIIHPFIPHISEELWINVGGKGLCIMARWPNTKEVVEKKDMKIPVQINGKIKTLVDIEIGEEKGMVLKKIMSDPKIIKNIGNKEIIKTIFVKDKIVNLVLK
jgi:leucyl-tRNA synthetase